MNIKHKTTLISSRFSEIIHFIKCVFRKKVSRKLTFYNPDTHKGNLPIRVLQYNVTYWLETVSPEFFTILLSEVQNNGLQPGIIYNIDKQKIIHAASINAASINSNRKISIYETFNAYLWCICYSLFVTFDEIVQKPHLKGKYTGVIDKKNEQIKAALDVFEYGMSLRNSYGEWNKSLPNPEAYDCKYSYNVEKANALFISAMYFILSHEVGHNYFNHVTYHPPTAAQSIQEELDADNFALDQVMSCKNQKLIPTLKHGAVAGICALLFLSPKLYMGGTYPDADNRIQNVMEKLQLNNLDLQWGMASLAFRLWGNYYGINFALPKTSENYSEVFYDVLIQMNKIKKP